MSHDLPPHNGFGNPRDAAGSCVGLVPKPPKRDLKKLLEKEGQVENNSISVVDLVSVQYGVHVINYNDVC